MATLIEIVVTAIVTPIIVLLRLAGYALLPLALLLWLGNSEGYALAALFLGSLLLAATAPRGVPVVVVDDETRRR